MKYFIFSDVHSFYDELMLALNNAGFDKDNPEHAIVSLAEISKLPTADVVQKSEYNRLEKSFNELISVLPENMRFMTNEQERDRDNAENL